MVKVSVLGTTTWGTTLAIGLARREHDVFLLARTEQEASQLSAQRENTRFVPGAIFPQNLNTTASPDEALKDATLVLVVVPSKTFRNNIHKCLHPGR